MRTTALACLTLGTTASAQSTYFEMLRDQGLSSTISTLQAIDAPSPSRIRPRRRAILGRN